MDDQQSPWQRDDQLTPWDAANDSPTTDAALGVDDLVPFEAALEAYREKEFLWLRRFERFGEWALGLICLALFLLIVGVVAAATSQPTLARLACILAGAFFVTAAVLLIYTSKFMPYPRRDLTLWQRTES